LESEQTGLLNYWRRLSLSVIFGLLATAVLGLVYRLLRQHRLNRHKMLALRGRISSDLHDEVGSNLATISLLSELGPSPENLDDIRRLSCETSLALREIVEINLASKRARAPFGERLRDIASLMLRDHEWTFDVSDSPLVDLEQRKNLISFFKESLHNIIRHARAKKVSITFDRVPPNFRLYIEDDGQGIQDPSPSLEGNFCTLRQRAASLGGTLDVSSEIGRGTRLTLLFPIHSRQ
jgi:signal transduction histidine kinase